jgi:sugar O-acyltransferase (sialic acid O-acetyltransferase NeuD family)
MDGDMQPTNREETQRTPVVVIGGGGHGKVLISVLRKLGHTFVGYTDSQSGDTILGVPYLGNDDILRELAKRERRPQVAIGVGKIDTSDFRSRLASQVQVLGYRLPTIVSPQATVNEEVDLEEGTAVFDGAVVNSGTVIGRLCIINTNSVVEHDCRLGENVHVAPGAIVSGGTTIGSHCLIGAGSTLIQGITVSAGCLIGAGSTVIGDLTVSGTYAGNPARRIGDGL